MKNKKLFVSIVAVVCLLSLVLCACGNKAPAADGTEKTFTVQVVHSDGTVMEKEITTTRQFLANALFDEGILTEEEGLTSGMYTIVDGEEASWDKNQAYWGFYVNDQYAIEGMNTTEIEDGAVYKLEYTLG